MCLPFGIASTSTPKSGWARSPADSSADDRPKLDDGVVAFALNTASPYHQPSCIQSKIGSVEEKDLTDLGFQRVEIQSLQGRRVVSSRNRQLEFSAVDISQSTEQILDAVGEPSQPR